MANEDFELMETDTVQCTNQGATANYVLIPLDIVRKFDINHYPIKFDLEAGINDEGHLVLKYTRKDDLGKYDDLRE